MGAVGKESFQMQTSPLDAESFPLAQKNQKGSITRPSSSKDGKSIPATPIKCIEHKS